MTIDRVCLPCGKCNNCCRGKDEIIALAEGYDDPQIYGEENITVGIDRKNFFGYGVGVGFLMLKRKENGDCIFLDRESGCAVYDHAPYVCRMFDCRVGYMDHMRLPRSERRKQYRTIDGRKEAMKTGRTMLEQYPIDRN